MFVLAPAVSGMLALPPERHQHTVFRAWRLLAPCFGGVIHASFQELGIAHEVASYPERRLLKRRSRILLVVTATKWDARDFCAILLLMAGTALD